MALYIYIAEALGILEKEELKRFADKIKKAIDNNESWEKVINKDLSWDRVEKKAVDILGQEKPKKFQNVTTGSALIDTH